MDEHPLVTFDRLVQGGDVGEGEQLGLGDVGAARAARPPGVIKRARPMSAPETTAGRREPDEGRDERRGQQRGAIGVAYGPLLRHGLGEHEDHDDFESRRDGDADRAEHLSGDDADERGGDELAEQDEQQDRGEERFGLLHEPAQRARSPLAGVLQRLGACP